MRLEKLQRFYKRFVEQNPIMDKSTDYEVYYSMLIVKPENMGKLLALKGFLSYSVNGLALDLKIKNLIEDRSTHSDVCFARVPKTGKYNAIWVYIKSPRKKKLSRTTIVRFFTLCKKQGLLPKYIKPDSIVDKDGNISVILDISANSIYDNEQLLYMFFCVLRSPREDPVFVKLATRMMSIGYHPITSWMYSSACAKSTSGHNFVDIISGTYPRYAPPAKIEDVKLSLTVALSIYEIVNRKVVHARFVGMRSGFRCATLLGISSVKKTEVLEKLFPKGVCSLEEFDKTVHSFKDAYV